MIYVVEGLDRCGKSSFIDVLRSNIKNPNILVIHSGKPPKGVNTSIWSTDYYDSLIKQSLSLSILENYNIILDRSWIGETVYGPIYRNDNIGLNRLEHEMHDYTEHFKLITFIDSAENALSREDGNSLSESISNKIKEINSFKEAHNLSRITNKMLIDWSKETFNKDFLIDLSNKVTK